MAIASDAQSEEWQRREERPEWVAVWGTELVGLRDGVWGGVREQKLRVTPSFLGLG